MIERGKAPTGRRIRLWREFRGLSLRGLEERSGIAYGLIGQYERGDSEVPFDAAATLAEALGVHVANLWDLMVPDPPLPLKELAPNGKGAP